jgi:CBS domain-containing protein
MHASVGDRIVIQTECVGRPARTGTVAEVLGGPDCEHYRVRWDDGHETLLYPGPDTRVVEGAGRIPEQRPRSPEAAPPAPDVTRAQAVEATAATAVSPHEPVERIMKAPVVTVEAHDTLRIAADALTDAEIGALVVMSGGTPMGIISERDVVHALAAGGDPDEVWASDVIALDTIWAKPSDPVSHVATLMRDGEVRHIPVRVRDTVVGMVSVRDVLKVLLTSPQLSAR